MSGKRIVVIGAGVVGRALTRALHARGDQAPGGEGALVVGA